MVVAVYLEVLEVAETSTLLVALVQLVRVLLALTGTELTPCKGAAVAVRQKQVKCKLEVMALSG
jgi:hypothetical protein